jgi:predicted nucleic acid-binding protein
MLLDTSGLVCCFDADEARHLTAVSCYDGSAIRITHNYVLAEFVALCQARGLPRDAALSFAAGIVQDADVEVVWIDSAIHADAMRMLQGQLDKSYSLCDAVSFVLMRQRNIASALTTDNHFVQAGFQRLLSQ